MTARERALDHIRFEVDAEFKRIASVCRRSYGQGKEPGNIAALFDVLRLALQRQQALGSPEVRLPAWAVKAASNHVADLLRARSNRLLRDMIDHERYEEVEGLREMRGRLKVEGGLWAWQGPSPEPGRRRSRQAIGPGTLFERAAMSLEGTFAACDAPVLRSTREDRRKAARKRNGEAVKKSWERVRRRMRVNPGRYAGRCFIPKELRPRSADGPLSRRRLDYESRLLNSRPFDHIGR